MSLAHPQMLSRHMEVVFEDEISLAGQQCTGYRWGWLERAFVCVCACVCVFVCVCLWRQQLCHISLGVALLFPLQLLDSPGFLVMFHCWGRVGGFSGKH